MPHIAVNAFCRLTCTVPKGIALKRRYSILAAVLFALVLVNNAGRAAEGDASQLADGLRPLLACLSGQSETFAVTGDVNLKIDGRKQRVTLRLERFSDDAFDLDLMHTDYAVQLRRRRDATAMALPLHKVVFTGQGETDSDDRLTPEGIAGRLVSPASMVSIYAPIAQSGDADSVALLLTGLLKVRHDAASGAWKIGNDVSIKFKDDGRTVEVAADDVQVRLALSEKVATPAAFDAWPGLETVTLERAELERQLARGVRRALEIVAPSPRLTSPARTAKKVEHGRAALDRWTACRHGQRHTRANRRGTWSVA